MKVSNRVTSKHFKISFLLITAIILTLGLSISFQSLLADWTAPVANPPTCTIGNPGCDFPIGNGTTLLQSMQGGLWIVNSAYPTSPYGLIVEKGSVGIGTGSPNTKLEVYGGHGDTKARLYSTGNGATLDASLDMWASEPGWTYNGSGIGNNVNGSPYYGRRNSTLGQSYIRFYNGHMYLATGSGDAGNSMFIQNNGNVGIGMTNPGAKLEVAGQVKITGGSPGANKVLTSDAAGLASWQTPASFSETDTLQTVTARGNTTNLDLVVNGQTINHQANNFLYLNSYDGLQLRINSDGAGASNFQINNSANNAILTATNGGNVGIGTVSPNARLNVVGTTNLSRDNTGECCSSGDFTLSLAENTAGTGKKAGIQFHNSGIAEGQLRLDNGTNGRELKIYSYQTDMDLHATGFVQGDQGLCIGNDCRASWDSISGATTFANLAGIPTRTAWSGVHRGFVAEQLSWKNYGNGHTIFDASQGTSPNGGAVNNTNSQVAWTASYPTLMGWNGVNTYGVRVDSSRVSDNADAVDGYHLNQNVTNGANPQWGTTYANNWFRSQGATGWYNESYGGGIWMDQSNYVRVYGGKGFTVDGNVGIGTTAPDQKLSVYGGRTHLSPSDGYALMLTTPGGGTASYQYIDSGGNLTFTDTTGYAAGHQLMTIQQAGNVGIGMTNPEAKLEVAGQVKITGGSPGVGKVLTSDASGLATWQSQVSISEQGLGDNFFHWGNGVCPAGTEIIYGGMAFNEDYTQGGGSAEPTCIMGGDPGSVGPGTNYSDLLYPVITGDVGRMPPGITASRYLKCASCYSKTTISEIWGKNICPSGWLKVYSGYGMGSYYISHGKVDRKCIENENFDASLAASNSGAYIYGSTMWSAPGGKEAEFPYNYYVKCAVCKKIPNFVGCSGFPPVAGMTCNGTEWASPSGYCLNATGNAYVAPGSIDSMGRICTNGAWMPPAGSCLVNGGTKYITNANGTAYMRIGHTGGYTDHWAYCSNGTIYVKSYYYQYSTGYTKTAGFSANGALAEGSCVCGGCTTNMYASTVYSNNSVNISSRVGDYCCSCPGNPAFIYNSLTW